MNLVLDHKDLYERENGCFGSFEAKESKGLPLQTSPEYKHFEGAKGKPLKSKPSLTSCLCLLGLLRPGHLSPLYFNWNLKKN